MTGGEKPGGVEHPDFNQQSDVELTLPISADEILKLNHGNTSVRSSLENPDVDCIEMREPGQEGSAERVHRIFDRFDLMFGLISLGFPIVTSQRASDDSRRAYDEWNTVDSDEDEGWAVILKDGVSISPKTLEDIPPMSQCGPVVELPLLSGGAVQANVDNTRLFYFGEDSILSHIRLTSRNETTGQPVWDYLFDVDGLMEDLKQQGFPVTRRDEPSFADAFIGQKWFDNNLDNTLQRILGDGESN